MHFPIILLPLVAVLQLFVGQGHSEGFSKMTPEDQKEILDIHNSIRRAVKPPASNMLKMTWSEKAAESAGRRAAKCLPSISPTEERTVDGVLCTENVLHAPRTIIWSQVINLWQKKQSNFQFGVGAINPEHDVYSYAQMIWYKSHLVGCAVAQCSGAKYPFVYICQYCPVGDLLYQLKTPYTEGPPCGDCPYNCEDKLCTNPCTYEDKKTNCKTVVALFDCESPMFELCKATCDCKTEII